MAGLVVIGLGACGDDSGGGEDGPAGGTHVGAAAGSIGSAGKSSGSGGNAQAGSIQGGANAQGGANPQGGVNAQGGMNAQGGTASGGKPGSSAGSSGMSAGAGGGGSGSASKSDGCGKPAPLAEAAQQTVKIGGTDRGYFLVPPPGYDPQTPYALVFAFHGAGGNGSGLRGYFGLEAASMGQAIFVYPDGVGGIWDLGNDGPDAKLFDSLLTTLQSAWCVDKGSVFTAGFSYGGWAATQMGKARATIVRGVASIEGGGPQGGGKGDAAVAAIIVHGSNDTAEPLASGESSRDHFLATNGCGATSSDVSPAPCKTYAGCKPGKAVEWCQHPGGHEVPPFAPAGIWSFFASLR